jgi:alkylation response protein AidB-like acyl-CoA dehydrogenase
MDFADTPEQAGLRDAVRAFARRHATPEQVRAVMASTSGYDLPTWERLGSDLGLTALAVPESHGGAGAGLAALAPVAALHCSRVFVQVAGEMIQLHGGIGVTWEHEADLYFKRAKSTQLLLGPVSALRAEIDREAGLVRTV